MFSKPICQRFGLTLGLFVGTALAVTPMAQAETSSPLKTARMSADLFLTGLEQSDPILIMAAAKLRKTLTLTPTERAPDHDGAPGQTESTEPLSWQQMLDTAEELATGDTALLGLIEDIRAERSKGVATGQVYSITSIRAGGTDTYPPLPYSGGDYAEVYVEGQASTDLNLFVHDTKGRLVCSDTDISAIAYCGWRPATSAGFTIIVKNKGAVASSYSLITN